MGHKENLVRENSGRMRVYKYDWLGVFGLCFIEIAVWLLREKYTVTGLHAGNSWEVGKNQRS